MNKSQKSKKSIKSISFSEILKFLKKSRLKIAALILALLTLGSTMTVAMPALAALTVGNTYTIESKHLNAYYSTGNWTTANNKTHNNSGQVALYNLKSTGEPLYCIQIYEGTDGTSAKAANLKGTGLWGDELTGTAQTIITRASIYGYDGTSANAYGYSATNAQLATQVIMWEAETGARTNYNTGCTSWAKSIFSNYPNALKCYNKILDTMKNHKEAPTFSSSTVTLKNTGSSSSGYVEITNTNSNCKLSDFNISDLTGNKIYRTLNGDNKLRIWTSDLNAKTVTMTFTKKGTNVGSALALTGSDQTKLYGKVEDPVKTSITVKVEAASGKVKLKKVDPKTNANIAGAKLEVREYLGSAGNYGNAKPLTYNASTGYYESETLYKNDTNNGIFKIVETSAPEGYLITNKYASFSGDIYKEGSAGTFKLADNKVGQELKITLKEDPVTANVKFQKFWSDTDENGNLVHDDGSWVGSPTIIDNQTILDSLNLEVRQYNKDTNKFDPTGIPLTFDKETKYFEAKGLTYTSKNQGWFKIYENYNGQAVPIGVVADTSQMIMKWNKDNGYEVNSYGAFRIQIDENGKPINGKTFYLYYTDPVQYGTLKVGKTADDGVLAGHRFKLTGTSHLGIKISETAVTDKNGEAIFKNIYTGYEYTVEEIETGIQYVVPPSQKVDINWNEVTEKHFHNPLKTSNAMVIKTAENGKVDGFKIRMYGKATDGTMVDETAVTDKQGIAYFENVLPGDNYTFDEVELPSYYKQPAPVTGVSVKYGKTTKVKFHNEFNRADLKVIKTSENGIVEGFKIHLFGTSDSGIKVDEYAVTDKNGVAWFRNVLVGRNYTAEEVEVPDPYITPPSQKVDILLNQTNKIEFYNAIVRGSVSGYKVDRETSEAIKGAVFGLFREGETVFTKDTALETDKSNGKGVFGFDDIEKGNYLIKELEPAKGYLPNDEIYSVTISKHEQVVEITVQNDKIPEIGTTALINEKKDAFSAEKIILKDTVTYQHLIPGKEYVVKGSLMDKAAGKPFTVYDKPVTAEAKFTPTKASGSVVVPFEFYTSDITEKTELVAFEELYRDNIQLAAHADLKDEGQTVTIHAPKSRTVATVNGEKDIFANESFVINDVVSYSDLVPGREYTVKGVLMNKKTNSPLLINGKQVTSAVRFTPTKADGEITVSFNIAANTITENTDVVVFEELYYGSVQIANHKDIEDKGQTITVHTPEIGTTATIENEKDAFSAETFTVEDVVTYSDLIPGKEYTIKGVLMNKATGKPFIVNDEPVASEITFTAEKASGSAVVTFEFDASVITEKTELVAFEELYKEDIQLAVHADLEDENQTVTVHAPAIRTTATVNEEKSIFAAEEFTVEDIVAYSDLVPGREYRLIGILMNKATGTPLVINGETVNSEVLFTPEEADGTVTASFNFDRDYITENTDIVVFEELYYRDVEITSHKDIEDSGQTVTVLRPAIRTTAAVNSEKDVFAAEKVITLEDVVSYIDLIPGKEYTLKGILMNKTTNEPFVIQDEPVLGETVFTPDEANGEVIVSFEFDASVITETTDLVAFEALYKGETLITSHEDINDSDQTITVHTPNIGTMATVNGKKEAFADGELTLEDVVAYRDLIPGKEYTISGVLMNKATGKLFEVDNKPVISNAVFIPEEADGTASVAFEFDSKGITKETELVAFEEIYKDDMKLAVHADINDEGQTVKIKIPEIPDTGDTGLNKGVVIGTVLCGAALLFSFIFYLRKKNREEKN